MDEGRGEGLDGVKLSLGNRQDRSEGREGQATEELAREDGEVKERGATLTLQITGESFDGS